LAQSPNAAGCPGTLCARHGNQENGRQILSGTTPLRNIALAHVSPAVGVPGEPKLDAVPFRLRFPMLQRRGVRGLGLRTAFKTSPKTVVATQRWQCPGRVAG